MLISGFNNEVPLTSLLPIEKCSDISLVFQRSSNLTPAHSCPAIAPIPCSNHCFLNTRCNGLINCYIRRSSALAPFQGSSKMLCSLDVSLIWTSHLSESSFWLPQTLHVLIFGIHFCFVFPKVLHSEHFESTVWDLIHYYFTDCFHLLRIYQQSVLFF